jgi:hypothetical protein
MGILHFAPSNRFMSACLAINMPPLAQDSVSGIQQPALTTTPAITASRNMSLDTMSLAQLAQSRGRAGPWTNKWGQNI